MSYTGEARFFQALVAELDERLADPDLDDQARARLEKHRDEALEDAAQARQCIGFGGI